MTTINGVPRELLERAVSCMGEDGWETIVEELSTLLAEQPQASAAQSAPDAHERWLSDPNNEPFPGGLSGIPVPALQSAPDEREAFAEKMRSRGGLVGWMLGWNGERYEYQPTQDCWEYFQAGAAWQRAQSAPVVPGPVEMGELRVRLESGHKQFEFEEYSAAYALPDGTHYLYAAPQPAAQVQLHGADTPDVDVEVRIGENIHYDHGPNAAEALARLALRVSRFHSLHAPTLAQPAARQDSNHEHTLFNEIRTSTPVSEDGEPVRYLLDEQQLQRIRELETTAPAAHDQGEVQRLREALEPFAAIADAYDPAEDDDHRVWIDAQSIEHVRLPLRAFRAARAALSASAEGKA